MRLRERLSGARSTVTKLEWGFATDSWIDIAKVPDSAESMLDGVAPLVEESTEARRTPLSSSHLASRSTPQSGSC